MPGRTEMKIMANITNLKLFCTIGRFPKKYPRGTKEKIHKPAPITL